MDRQERIKILQELALEKVGGAKFKSWEALTEQIAEAELLNKVSGGVEKKQHPKGETHDPFCAECSYNIGFNEAIDLCNAHFANKIRGIKHILIELNCVYDANFSISMCEPKPNLRICSTAFSTIILTNV